MRKTGSSSSDQKVIQHSSEIEMLTAKLEALRKEHMQLIDIHSRCRSQTKIFVSIQTDVQVST